MCYGSKPVVNAKGGVDWIPNDDFNRMYKFGEIVVRKDGYHYAKDTLGAFLWRNGRIVAAPMRWDLVPRDYRHRENLTLADMIRKKNSRAKDPDVSGRKLGFDSYNARVETVANLFSFKAPWREGLRMATPVLGFKERPNMEGAPAEFKGREYEVLLDEAAYLAGIYDVWRNAKGEKLESCSILTMDSLGNDRIRAIWHERTPIILKESQVQEWLDPQTTPERAAAMFRLYPPERMEVKEVVKESRVPGGAEQTKFDL